jgi:two-component system sensor histidine kinase UhpB
MAASFLAKTSSAPAERFAVYLSRFSARDFLNLALFAVAYSVASGYVSLFGQTEAAPLWFPDSVLLCALLLTPYGRWWPYLTVALAIRFIPAPISTLPPWFLLATVANDLIKAGMAGYLLRRFSPTAIRLSNLRTFAVYSGIAVFLLPALSAFGGAAARQALGFAFWPAWNQWFIGDALANLVLTPALLCWCWGRQREQHPDPLEIVLWLIGFAVSLHYSFSLIHSNYAPVAFYAPVPSLIWAASRFGLIGASSSLSLIALLSMVGITGAQGLFPGSPAPQNVLFVQLFLAVMSVPILFAAILIEERGAVEMRLRESQEKLRENYRRARELAVKLINAQEDERKRIALELHDDIGQRLSLLSVALDEWEVELPSRLSFEHAQLSGLRRSAKELVAAVHDLSHQLHSSTFQHLGLVGGLRGICRSISQQHHIAVDFQYHEVSELSYDTSLCLFRVAQEALNNAVKHGRAKQIAVQLVQNNGSVQLIIKDAGVGFDSRERSTGLGLVSMQERLRILGGTLTLISSPGHGTLIEAVVKTTSSVTACPD